jgi:multidrug resistance protein, MATE family
MNIPLNQDDRRGPEMRLFLLSLPIMSMTLSRMLMGFISFVVVSQLGTEAQAAVSPATILVFTIACLGMGVSMAVQTFVSQAEGRGEPHRAAAYAWQSLYVSMFMALLAWPIALTTSYWHPIIAHYGGHSPTMAAMEVEYLRIALWWVPLGVLSMGLDGFFMGIQKPRVTAIAVGVSLFTDAIGNYALVFGKFGCPKLGIAGSAIAVVAGWGVRCAILVVALLLPEFDRKYGTRHALGFRWKNIKDLLKVGSPTSLQWLVDIGAWLVFLAVIMPRYGVAAAAASNVGLQYTHLSFMPALGIGIALCSQVGHAIGAGQPDKALRQTVACMRLTGAYMGFAAVLFIFCGRRLMGLMNQDPAVIDAGFWVMLGAGAFQIFDAMCITYTNALRGAGDTRTPALLFFVCCWAIFISGGLLVAHWLPQFGLLGPWGMCALYIIVLGLLLRWRWRTGQWRKIRLFGENKPTEQAAPAELDTRPDQPPTADGDAEPAKIQA